MEHVWPNSKSVTEFTNQFKVKRNDVPRIMRKSTYSFCKPMLDAVGMDLINMEDPRVNIWGEIHLVTDTSQLPGGPA